MTDFTEYVAQRHERLRRTAYLLTRDWAIAEDLVQTALAKAWIAWRRIDGTPKADQLLRALTPEPGSWEVSVQQRDEPESKVKRSVAPTERSHTPSRADLPSTAPASRTEAGAVPTIE
ncbi:sigma factor [Streptosporangium subroseum]|uniref:sigma factor n=1 Tax=Streptosporangium subroseum TaxID=106412 RepID=UPI0034431BD8